MKKLTNFAALLLACSTASAQEITSPDGHIKVSVSATQGKPSYCILLDNDTIIKPSSLGLSTNIGDATSGMSLSSVSEISEVKESYTLPNAKVRDISYTANERTWHFSSSDDRPSLSITFHVDNSNVAFRYTIKPYGDKRSCLVQSESTSYTLPLGTTTFLCPQMTPQTGFARTAPSYETFYEFDGEMGKNGHGRGFTFPALFKETFTHTTGKKSEKKTVWVMLSETNVGGNYCGSRIVSSSQDNYAIAYPEETEFGGVGSSAPGLMLTEKGADTPWRTITIGTSLKPISETTIQWDLVKPQYQAKYDYKYGRSAWSWIIRMDASCNLEEQKEYVDFAADMGWEYLLVDAWWDSNIGYDNMGLLSKYAQSKGVSLFLWYNSNGYWNDAPQGPRGKMHRMIDRRREMEWMQKVGIKGIKVDFIGSDKQQTMQMYEDILADANDYGIMVIFHGCTLQRGWERMYPNFISCEAVRASENLSFGQYDNDIEAKCGTIHPILRNAVGNMDFGGSALNKRYSKDNNHGNFRRTSDVYALATSILFQTPVQNFALAPNNLNDAPSWAIEFMKKVPVEWQEMQFIDGYPGKYLVMARKSGGKWYYAAINADEKPLTLTLPTWLYEQGSTVNIYQDDANLNGSVKPVKVTKKGTKIVVPCNGGAVAM